MKYRNVLIFAVATLLVWSFWRSGTWLQLCAGLAMFLFGMQLLEEGLRQLAGGRLEQWLARSTGTPRRGLLFGIGATAILQSTTLVSLLTIAFVSAGLIELAGGIAILFGAKLGTITSIWLLALAGQDFSLSPLALPLLVFGVLAGFSGARGKAVGRVLLGVGFIFLGIDQIKDGFSASGNDFGLDGVDVSGIAGVLLFAGAGLLATLVLQSSHATLILTLAAMAGGHLLLGQAMAVMIGTNVGAGISTAVVGVLGASRGGQRLALARVIFNTGTSLVALTLLLPLTWLVKTLGGWLGLADNALLQLALFMSLFNILGVSLFWPWQGLLARSLMRFLPERKESSENGLVAGGKPAVAARIRARHLSDSALESAEAATAAIALELRHLGQRCMEVICRNLDLPVERLKDPRVDPARLQPVTEGPPADAEALYQHYVKGVYADLLSFMGRMEVHLDEAHQEYWQQAQVAAWQLVNAVKGTKHLQKNFTFYLRGQRSVVQEAYLELWRQLFKRLHSLYTFGVESADLHGREEGLTLLQQQAAQFDSHFRQRLFLQVRDAQLDGFQAGSLMNDLGYVDGIFRDLGAAIELATAPESLRHLRRVGEEAREPV